MHKLKIMDNKLYNNQIDIAEDETESLAPKVQKIANKVSLYAEEEKKPEEEDLIEIDEDSLYYDEKLDNAVKKNEPLYGEKKEKEVKPGAPKIKSKSTILTEKINHYGKIVAAFLIPITIISLISFIILNNTDNGQYKLGYISKGSVCEVGEGEGYFIRETESILSPAEGIFVSCLDEGTAVNAGDIIGYIASEDNKNVISKLNQTSASILTLMKLEMGSIDSAEKAALENIEKSIEERQLELVSMSRGGSFDEIADIQEEISIYLEEKNQLILELETGNETINTLKRQKNELLTTIEEELIPVVATRSGILSYNFSSSDELENEYYQGLSGGEGVSDLSEASKLQKKSFYDVISSDVSEGSQVARLIVEDNYYIILKLDSGELVKNQTITLSNKSQTFNTTGYVLSTSLGEGYAIISASRGISGCLSLRSESLSYDLEKSSGYCVQLSAICNIDEKTGIGQIAVLKNNKVQFVTVYIEATEENKAIVSQGVDENGNSFKTGDCYIVNPEGVRKGQKISS